MFSFYQSKSRPSESKLLVGGHTASNCLNRELHAHLVVIKEWALGLDGVKSQLHHLLAGYSGNVFVSSFVIRNSVLSGSKESSAVPGWEGELPPMSGLGSPARQEATCESGPTSTQ